MCTSIAFNKYFGRNLDLEYKFKESVVITPRNFNLKFKYLPQNAHHHAIIGMAYVVDGYPLYYDGANEQGLSMASLNFTKSAVYSSKKGVCVHELIPYILSNCKTVAEAKELFKSTPITDTPFNDNLQTAKLHFILYDKTDCVVVESTKDGLEIYDNPTYVLTNEPTFDIHLKNIKDCNTIPGDWTSESRFIRAAYVRAHAVSGDVTQFFKILESVAMVDGVVPKNNAFMKTQYSSCIDTESLIYYYKTYSNSQVTAVKLNSVNLNSTNLICYPLIWDNKEYAQN